jgi:hypothetical protein
LGNPQPALCTPITQLSGAAKKTPPAKRNAVRPDAAQAMPNCDALSDLETRQPTRQPRIKERNRRLDIEQGQLEYCGQPAADDAIGHRPA